jgi:hypothetical protein
MGLAGVLFGGPKRKDTASLQVVALRRSARFDEVQKPRSTTTINMVAAVLRARSPRVRRLSPILKAADLPDLRFGD